MKSYERILLDPLVAKIMKTWPEAVITMKEPSEIEVAGMFEGSDRGGQYLESIGKTDLAQMTEGEWMTFIETVIRGYEDKCMDLYGDPPF